MKIGGRWLAAARDAVASVVLLAGVYLLLIGTISPAEGGVAVGSAATGLLALRTRRTTVQRPRGSLRWLRPLAVAVLADTTNIVIRFAHLVADRLAAGRVPAPGTGRLRRLSAGPGSSGAGGEARRALAELALSMTPGTYIVDADADRGVLLVHALGAEPSRLERSVES